MNSYSVKIFVFSFFFGLLYSSDITIDEKIQRDLSFDYFFGKTNELAKEPCRSSPFHLAVGNDDFELFDFDFQPIFEIPVAKCIEQKDEVFPTSNFEDFGIESDLSEDSSESSSILLDDQRGYHQDGDQPDNEDQVDSSDMAEQHSQLSRVKCLTEDRDLSRRTVFQTLLERFRSESKLFSSTRINWNLLNREDIPDKYEDVPINGTSLQSTLVFKNKEIVDNIHFFEHSLLSSMVKQKQKRFGNSYKKCKDTKKQLRELFESQLPGEPYNLRKYDVLNWPQEINLYGKKWTASEVQEIKKVFHSFRFVERSTPASEDSRVKDIEVKKSRKMTIHSAHSILLERFREETGNHSDLIIRWKFLNREYIPIEYKDIIIDSKTVRTASIYQNREIFDNIHFFKSSKKKGNSEVDIVADTSSPLDLAACEVDLEASIFSAPISDQFLDENIGLAMESFRSELFDRDFHPIFEFHTAMDELFPSSNFLIQPSQKSDRYLKSSKFSSISESLLEDQLEYQQDGAQLNGDDDSSDRTNIHFYKPAEATTTTISKRRRIDGLDS